MQSSNAIDILKNKKQLFVDCILLKRMGTLHVSFVFLRVNTSLDDLPGDSACAPSSVQKMKRAGPLGSAPCKTHRQSVENIRYMSAAGTQVVKTYWFAVVVLWKLGDTGPNHQYESKKKNGNQWFLGARKTRKQRRMDELFITFSAAGVPGTPLGHPREPKWSQDLPQESPGPLWASILHDSCIFFEDFSYSFNVVPPNRFVIQKSLFGRKRSNTGFGWSPKSREATI